MIDSAGDGYHYRSVMHVNMSTLLVSPPHDDVEDAIEDMKHLGEKCRVLVCDGEQRTGLAVVRALGSRGHDVAVCSHENPSLAGTSKWARRRFHVPNPRVSAEAYLTAVKMAATAWAADIILPLTDQSNLVMLGQRAAFAPAIVPGPSLESFLHVSDKRRVLERARSMGIPTPEQIVITAAEANNPPIGDLEGPYAIKSAHLLQGAKRQHVLYAKDRVELRQQIRSAPRDSYPLLVQRRIVGPGVGVFLLIDKGQRLATFAHERVREQPPSGGASVFSRSASVPPELINDAIRLLTAHNFSGAAMVEFKRERSTGIHYLMEINGRLWGSLQLAIDSGVDFPNLIVDLVSGRTPAPVTNYAVGVSLRSTWGDFDNVFMRMRHTPEALDMPPGAPGKLTALLDFFSPSFRGHQEIFRMSDPAPFWFDSKRYLRTLARGLGRATTRRVGRDRRDSAETPRDVRVIGRNSD